VANIPLKKGRRHRHCAPESIIVISANRFRNQSRLPTVILRFAAPRFPSHCQKADSLRTDVSAFPSTSRARCCSLFIAQRRHGVDLHRPSRGHVAGEYCNRTNHQRHQCKRQHVGWLYPEKHSRYQARKPQSG